MNGEISDFFENLQNVEKNSKFFERNHKIMAKILKIMEKKKS
jgi:hypothetical protein